jgi:hypothetical protein
MKGKRRHELQTNELADWVGHKIEEIKPYTSWIIGGVIVFAVAVTILVIRSSRVEGETAKGWEKYSEAKTDGFDAIKQNQQIRLEKALSRLKKVAADYADTTLGDYARLTIGDLHMETGAKQNNSNRPAAIEHFKKAEEQFAAVARSSSEFKDRAEISLANSLEWQWQLSKARTHYAKVQGPYGRLAQVRARDLDRGTTKEFYVALENWKPKPPSDLLDKPPFDLDDDGPVAFDYDRYLDATAAGLDVPDPEGADAPPDDATSANDGNESPDAAAADPAGADSKASP